MSLDNCHAAKEGVDECTGDLDSGQTGQHAFLQLRGWRCVRRDQQDHCSRDEGRSSSGLGVRAQGDSAQADGRGEVTLAGDGCGQQATEALVSGEVKEEQGITCFEMEFERVCAELGACECPVAPFEC